MDPDPDFPTVVFPNPEEGKSALVSVVLLKSIFTTSMILQVLAMKKADEHGCKIILANDPDADRLAIAENINGSWKIFNGNEIGALLAKWALDGYKQKLLKEGEPFQGLFITCH